MPKQPSSARLQKFQRLRQSLVRQGIILAPPTPLKESRPHANHSNRWPKTFPVDLVKKPVLHVVYPDHHADISSYGFVFMAMRDIIKTPGQVSFLWCSTASQIHEQGTLFASGLQNINIDPASIIQVTTRRTADVLWAMEEAAHSGALKAVIGIVDNLSFTQSRRLSLAAAKGQTTIFMIRPYNCSGADTAFSRWKTSSQPGQINTFNPRAPGIAALQVQLLACRTGHTGKWICHYEPSQDNLSVAATSGHRTPSASQQPKPAHPVRLAG